MMSRSIFLFLFLFIAFATLAVDPVRVRLDPDYTDLTLPPNIAPLNADILGVPSGAKVKTVLSGKSGKSITLSSAAIRYPLAAWRKLLEANIGESLTLTVQTNGVAALNSVYTVSPYPIDSTLVYRLIRPSYESYNRMGIYQRDLTTFKEKPLFRNDQLTTKQCVNCHTFQNKNPDTFHFHIRGELPGTVIFNGSEDVRKRNFRVGPLFASGVYPAWHPTRPCIVYSINETAQAFYTANPDKIEVYDARSDMVLYDLSTDTLTPIELEPNRFESFPAWAPDGKTLYTVAAEMSFDVIPDEKTDRFVQAFRNYTNITYNLYARAFDPETHAFGPPQKKIDAASTNNSITHPKPSPDGRWLTMSVGNYGCFHTWHKASDLFLLDLKNNTLRQLQELNSTDSESYQSWSSNGRWLVFSSRRRNSTQTRPYFASFDPETGYFGKPFILPQESPRHHLDRLDSYNIPELIKGPVPYSPRVLKNQAKAPTFNAKWFESDFIPPDSAEATPSVN